MKRLARLRKRRRRTDCPEQDECEHGAGFESMEVGHESSPQS
jgi:hypothetical protein